MAKVILVLDASIRCAFINYVARSDGELLMGSHCIDTDDIRRGEPIVITPKKEDEHGLDKQESSSIKNI